MTALQNLECGDLAPHLFFFFLPFPQLPPPAHDNIAMSPIYHPHPEQRWPHSPAHWFYHSGIYMVTAATHRKLHFYDSPEKRDLLQDLIFCHCREYGWELEAWAVLANHYHLVLRSPGDPSKFRYMINKIHTFSAKALNEWDGTPGRRIWFQYWDSLITFESSFLARLAYVHVNAVHHGLVESAEDYPWCSASWFVRNAPPELTGRVRGFRFDRLRVYDDF